ncbi:MAG TPA: sugar phosphate nucleotidyltransferase, partial [Burkholderiaceae bacterium]|nr:sugar phosphate nucleotidyltransferase [Burkholderiaceae bacterium]
VGNEPFAVLLADDFMDVEPGQSPVLKQMTDIYAREGSSILAVQDVPRAQTGQYGIVSVTPYLPNLERVDGLVEKPLPDEAPSTLGVVGRYVLNNRVFDYLENLGEGTGGEIQLTDGIAALMQAQTVLAYRYTGQRYDCGSKLGYLKATLAMGMKHPETGKEFAAYVREFVQELG